MKDIHFSLQDPDGPRPDTQVFIVADDPLVRAGLALLLEKWDRITVIGRGVSPEEARSLAAPPELQALPERSSAPGSLAGLAEFRRPQRGAGELVILWDLGPDPEKATQRLASGPHGGHDPRHTVQTRQRQEGAEAGGPRQGHDPRGGIEAMGVVWLAPDGIDPGQFAGLGGGVSTSPPGGGVFSSQPMGVDASTRSAYSPGQGATPGWGLLRREAETGMIVQALQSVQLGLIVLDPGLVFTRAVDLTRAMALQEVGPDGTPSYAPIVQAESRPQASARNPDAEPSSMAEMVEPLTPREAEVLRLVAEGLPNKVIANQLRISEHTVKFHLNTILGKLQASSRTEAVTRAARLGWIIL